MASIRAKLSYQRLKKLPPESTDIHEREETIHEAKGAVPYHQEAAEPAPSRRRTRSSGWLRLTAAGRGGDGRRWRRPRVRVAGLLRRKVRLVRCAVAKVVRRLKEGRPYLGELFAGNYMFMQVSPSPTMGYVDKYSFQPAHGFAHHHHQQKQLQHGATCRPLSIPRVAA